jgi:flagellar biosynthetic protein FliQ
MEQGLIIEIASKALLTILYVSAPMLGLGLVVGLAISIFQATTHIQEQSLTFIPKMIAILGSIVLFGPWMLSILTQFTQELLLNINNWVR